MACGSTKVEMSSLSTASMSRRRGRAVSGVECRRVVRCVRAVKRGERMSAVGRERE